MMLIEVAKIFLWIMVSFINNNLCLVSSSVLGYQSLSVTTLVKGIKCWKGFQTHFPANFRIFFMYFCSYDVLFVFVVGRIGHAICCWKIACLIFERCSSTLRFSFLFCRRFTSIFFLMLAFFCLHCLVCIHMNCQRNRRQKVMEKS